MLSDEEKILVDEMLLQFQVYFILQQKSESIISSEYLYNRRHRAYLSI